jgi:polynucleotide 5'-hydroxyl-kinase GRC3/NOL9
LVVNTQGWVKGLGADLLGQIEELVQATHTFAFQADDAVARDADEDGTLYSTPLPEEACGFGQVITVSSTQATPLLSKYTAAEFRILATLSYMHSIPPQGLASSIRSRWVFDHPLVRQAPWQVDMAAIREIYLTGEGADGVIEEDLALALNGSIVALLERTAASSDVPDQRYVPGRELPSPADTNCLGLAVLRSVSPALQTVHLLSPVDPESFSRVSIMIKGELELPVTAMLDWQAGPTVDSVGMMGLKWEDVPFLQFKGVDGIGMGRRKWRRNIMRKGQVA